MKILKFMPIIISLVVSSELMSQDNIEFYGETIDNEEITFSKINSVGPTLVNFWALWCKPCRAEMKHLVDIYNKYKENGFTILGINQDTPRSLAKVKSFSSSHKITFPIIKDPNQEIFQQFNGQSIPLSVLYNREGKVVYSQVGYLPGDEVKLEAEIRKVVGLEN